MKIARMCLVALLGAIIGASVMALSRPQSVAAQGNTVYTDYVAGVGGTRIRGTRVVGFACASDGRCWIASQ